MDFRLVLSYLGPNTKEMDGWLSFTVRCCTEPEPTTRDVEQGMKFFANGRNGQKVVNQLYSIAIARWYTLNKHAF